MRKPGTDRTDLRLAGRVDVQAVVTAVPDVRIGRLRVIEVIKREPWHERRKREALGRGDVLELHRSKLTYAIAGALLARIDGARIGVVTRLGLVLTLARLVTRIQSAWETVVARDCGTHTLPVLADVVGARVVVRAASPVVRGKRALPGIRVARTNRAGVTVFADLGFPGGASAAIARVAFGARLSIFAIAPIHKRAPPVGVDHRGASLTVVGRIDHPFRNTHLLDKAMPGARNDEVLTQLLHALVLRTGQLVSALRVFSAAGAVGLAHTLPVLADVVGARVVVRAASPVVRGKRALPGIRVARTNRAGVTVFADLGFPGGASAAIARVAFGARVVVRTHHQHASARTFVTHIFLGARIAIVTRRGVLTQLTAPRLRIAARAQADVLTDTRLGRARRTGTVRTGVLQRTRVAIVTRLRVEREGAGPVERVAHVRRARVVVRTLLRSAFALRHDHEGTLARLGLAQVNGARIFVVALLLSKHTTRVRIAAVVRARIFVCALHFRPVATRGVLLTHLLLRTLVPIIAGLGHDHEGTLPGNRVARIHGAEVGILADLRCARRTGTVHTGVLQRTRVAILTQHCVRGIHAPTFNHDARIVRTRIVIVADDRRADTLAIHARLVDGARVVVRAVDPIAGINRRIGLVRVRRLVGVLGVVHLSTVVGLGHIRRVAIITLVRNVDVHILDGRIGVIDVVHLSTVVGLEHIRIITVITGVADIRCGIRRDYLPTTGRIGVRLGTGLAETLDRSWIYRCVCTPCDQGGKGKGNSYSIHLSNPL